MKTTRLSFVLTLYSSQLFNSEPVQSVFHGDVCWYTCTESGGCKVEYTGPQRRGATKGSCIFGGSYSGTPKECKDCSSVTKCNDSVEEPELEQTSQSLEVTSQEVSLVKKVADGITCVTTCDNWPYRNCKMELMRGNRDWGFATCIPPYSRQRDPFTGNKVKHNNYPECARIPRGCERCDDTCAIRDGKSGRLDY